MANRLQHEKSLYLRQHANNPVDWYPWGEEALERAKREDKPLLVSIGYSSCHWCHVMAHECFEDEFIASLMNRHFVCIKVDREERPDLDHVFMEAVQMIANHGGWPLNVFCLPDGKPFFGGTYFPPEDRGSGMIPWPQLLMRVSSHYEKSRSDLEENARNLVHNLMSSNYPRVEEGDPFHKPSLLNAAAMLLESHDNVHGGWGEGPKFPHSPVWLYLARIRSWGAALLPRYSSDDNRGEANQESWRRLAEELDTALLLGLEAMARRGLYDHLGGGFFRYCVDKEWNIPHFEKMLYDNGQLLEVLVMGYAHTSLPWCREQVEQTIDWLEQEMARSEGGYASSLDADSEGGEGAYYVWTEEEIQQVLGDKSDSFMAAWDIDGPGNFEGKYIHLHYPPSVGEERSSWKEELDSLKRVRDQRKRPGRDDKVLLSWNSLVIRGLAYAAYYFKRADWYDLAAKHARFLLTHMRDQEGKWYSVFHDSATQRAFLDDVALYAEACLVMSQFAPLFGQDAGEWQDVAVELGEYLVREFKDTHESGFFFSGSDQPVVVVRKKEFWDGALPAGNSVLLGVFHRLWLVTGEQKWQEEWLQQITMYPDFAQKVAQAIPHALSHWAEALAEPAIIKKNRDESWEELHQLLTEHPIWPILFQESEREGRGFEYCRGTTCKATSLDAGEVAELLEKEFSL